MILCPIRNNILLLVGYMCNHSHTVRYFWDFLVHDIASVHLAVAKVYLIKRNMQICNDIPLENARLLAMQTKYTEKIKY